jgi:nucleotide-binding universal stress UspA family protein
MQPGTVDRRLRVIVGVNGSASSVKALRRGAQEALLRDAVLVPVHAWLPPTLIMPPVYPSIEPEVVLEDAGWRRLWETYDAAFKKTPWNGDVEPVVTFGRAGASLLKIADRRNDLLVLGASHRNVFKKLRRPQIVRYCVARAECEILIVPYGDAMACEWRYPLTRRRA